MISTRGVVRPTIKTISVLLSNNSSRIYQCNLIVPSSTTALSSASSLCNLVNEFQAMSFSTSSRKQRTNYNSNRNSDKQGRGGGGGGNDTSSFLGLRNQETEKRKYINPKLRPHAIQVLGSDYTDYDSPDDNDDEYELDKTIYNKFSNNDYSATEDEDEKEWHRQRETEAYQKQLEEDAKRSKWIENAKPPIRVPKIDSSGRAYGRGGRKVSTARVWIYPGEGMITINRRDFLDYFPRDSDREMILSPFVATKTCGMFDMTVRVDGGGVT